MKGKFIYPKEPRLVTYLHCFEQHQVKIVSHHQSSNINMEPSIKRATLVVAELIKRIQRSRGQIREALLVNVRKSFEMKPEEKFVVSKLRLILYHLRANEEHFQIKAEGNGKSEVNWKIKSATSFSNGFFTMELAKNFAKATTILKPEQKEPRSRRMSLEEKQMKKLKEVKLIPEDKNKGAENLSSSKLSYLKSYGLVPKVVYL